MRNIYLFILKGQIKAFFLAVIAGIGFAEAFGVLVIIVLVVNIGYFV